MEQRKENIDKVETNNSKRLLVALLLFFTVLIATLSVGDFVLSGTHLVELFDYDFRLGIYPISSSGTALIQDEGAYKALRFDELDDSFNSATFDSTPIKKIEISISGFELVGDESMITIDAIFTINGFDSSETLIETRPVSSVSIDTPVSIYFQEDDITSFQLIMTNYATSLDSGGLALGVDIMRIRGFRQQ